MQHQFPIPLPASLARRLAEAADGYRNIKEVFFVAGYKFPHPIKDFSTFEEAEAYRIKKGFTETEYGVFGPYKTTDELDNLNLIGAESIKKIEMEIFYTNGKTEKTILPACIDSIFLNLSAFDKFVFPYYCQVYGVEYVKIMRDNLLAEYNKSKGNSTVMYMLAKDHSMKTIISKLYDGEELAE